MKIMVLTILAFTFITCNKTGDRSSANTKGTKIISDTLSICSFDKFLNSSQTPQLALDIYLDHDWDLSNDQEALALLDSLTSRDTASRAFYFKIITLSNKKSDGYYAESLGSLGKRYVEQNTKEFASYFDDATCFPESDLEIWADIVLLEFGILAEEANQKPIADNFVQSLKTKCQSCSATQKVTIDKFGAILIGKWNELSKTKPTLKK